MKTYARIRARAYPTKRGVGQEAESVIEVRAG